ncbi:hypothetical protein JQK15_25305 [Sphingobium sp. BHU LFT2]|uniref:hypothetical protein n=1 Tax=Sphingobium sp. BHU LFT2 TaxID=2807634 RepID=UPI001BEBE092|nr:hypothetical protein [Sphingobium sp. BHU LFT2]MBT2246826.1 hypothetical protein [Sphingobium sp. BHU LFT2]
MSELHEANAIREEALATLEEARAKLHAWRFLKALRRAPDEQRAEAATRMLDVALARQTLAAAILSEIVDELEKQEDDLKLATEALDDAVKDLNRVKPVLDAIGQLLGVVGKIVALV